MKNEAICQECVDALRSDYQTGSQSGIPVRGLRTRTLLSGCLVFSSLEYSGICANTIVQFKKHGNLVLARHLRGLLAAAIAEAAEYALGLVTNEVELELCPVPSAKAADWRRGFNPIRTLLNASGLSASRVLKHSGRESQKKLNHKQRRVNANGSIMANKMLQGRYFILVDDVVTSGATLTSAITAIQNAKGTVLACATLATTPRISQAPPSSRDFHSYPD